MNATMDVEAQEALAAVDRAADDVLGALRKCGELVEAGKLTELQVMEKFHGLAARLMQP